MRRCSDLGVYRGWRAGIAGLVMLTACSSAAKASHPVLPTSTSARTTSLLPTTASTRVTTTTRRITRPESAPARIAQLHIVFTDTTRATPARGSVPGHSSRTLVTSLRWPVAADGTLARGKHTLVVFAHGYAVSANTYSALLDDLARAGAIVAAPEFPGESAALPGPPNENDLANEPCDLRFVAKLLLAQPPPMLARALAVAPLVFAGHSDGGTAVVAAAYSKEPCSGPRPVAVVAMSPDDVAIDDVVSNAAPALLAMSGTADTVNPLPNTERLWRHAPSPAWLVTLDGGSHLGTFTTDPARSEIDTIISRFIATGTVRVDAALQAAARQRIHVVAR